MGTPGYEAAGVSDQGEALSAVARHLGPTFSIPDDAEVISAFGDYAAILKVAPDLAIAIGTDGVGSKTVVASQLGRYDTIGFDCVAMNVNDIICVGATPIALVDYLGVHTLDAARTDAILAGLAAAAAEAGIAVPGGELAQLPDVIGAAGDDAAFDLVGTCVGVVHPDRVVRGEEVTPGDVLIGLDSSGIHSNGLTLARKVLLDDAGYSLDETIPVLGRTVGDELLEPTRIYVRAVAALRTAGVAIKGMIHVTGDGLTNLCRLAAPVGYSIDDLPDEPPVFRLIRDAGGLDAAEMFRVFNMGVGFVVVTTEEAAQRACDVVGAAGYGTRAIGRVTTERGVVEIVPAGLRGSLTDGRSVFEPV